MMVPRLRVGFRFQFGCCESLPQAVPASLLFQQITKTTGLTQLLQPITLSCKVNSFHIAFKAMRPNEALNEITSIREKLEILESRHSLRSWSIAVSAFVFAAFGVWQTSSANESISGAQNFVLAWIGVFVVCSVVVLGELIWRSFDKRSCLTLSWARQMVRQLLPFALAGVLVTLAAIQQPNSLAWLPGIWSIIIGLGLCSTARLLPISSQVAAGWLVLFGGVAMSLPEWSASYPHLVVVFSFAIGQAILAVSLYWGGNRNG